MSPYFGRRYSTCPERSLDPPQPKECPEDCEHMGVDGQCQGSPPEDCQDYDDGHDIDDAYERARDYALEEEQS